MGPPIASPMINAARSELSTAKGTEKEKEPVEKIIEPSLVKSLEEFTEACGTVVDLNLMLSRAMEKARGDIALVLLQPSPDYQEKTRGLCQGMCG